MKTGSYACRLGDACTGLAVVQIADRTGAQTRGCFTHAYEAMRAIEGAKVVWPRTHVNEWGAKALEMCEA